jgi:hypothetical protein
MRGGCAPGTPPADLSTRAEERAAIAVSVEMRWSATAKNRSGVATGMQRLDAVPDRHIVLNDGASIAHE